MINSRRNFIRNSVTAAVGMSLIKPINAFSMVAPGDKVNVGLIGTRNMGFGDLRGQLATGRVNCIGLCDVDMGVLEKRAAEVEKDFGQKPKLYSDFRKLLENKDLDAVIIGTPDHWHCLMTVYACQAGLDVYVEKPMANTIEECNIIVKAAKRYNRVVQVGQQQRSGAHWQRINRMVKEGRIGKLRKINIWGNFNYGIGLLKQPDQPVPKGVDYNMWLGPAPARPFNINRFHRMWRMYWDYGGGVMTDWGVHLTDMAFWAKELTAPPKKTMASGGNFSFEEYDHETFDTTSVIYDMGDCTVTWDQTSGTQKGPWDKNYGLAFVGDMGTILADRSGYKIIPEWDTEKDAPRMEEGSGEGGESHAQHAANFIECIKTRNTPACPPETGRVAAIATHIANIAVRSGEGLLIWDDVANKFTNSKKANRFLEPEYRAPWKLPKV